MTKGNPQPFDIRFITRKWSPAVGGIETYCVRLCTELAKRNHLDIIALPGKENGDAPGTWQMLTFGLGTALRLLFTRPARIVHIGDISIWPLGWLAQLRHRNIKIILSAHGSDLSFAGRKGLAAKLYGFYIGLGARLLGKATVIANSDWIASLATKTGFNTVITVALATDIKAPDEQEFIPGKHNGQLFFAGRIVKSKGLSHLVNTVLPLLHQPLKIRVAGTIWDEEEALILKNPHVEYLGVLQPEALASEYANALCVVVPSVRPEGFRLVAAEASAAGGLVLAANHSGLAQTCTADVGFVADIQDPEAWARQLDTFANWTLEQRSTFIRRSQKVAQQRFSWARVAAETQKAYG
jgi:glycosyltransferase involved in cell wall biosynthesis